MLPRDDAAIFLPGDAGTRADSFHWAALEGSFTEAVTVVVFWDWRATLKRFGLDVLLDSWVVVTTD